MSDVLRSKTSIQELIDEVLQPATEKQYITPTGCAAHAFMLANAAPKLARMLKVAVERIKHDYTIEAIQQDAYSTKMRNIDGLIAELDRIAGEK